MMEKGGHHHRERFGFGLGLPLADARLGRKVKSPLQTAGRLLVPPRWEWKPGRA
jgi:hypothetical protein